MSLIGYARVSSVEQTLSLQLDALAAAGVTDDCVHTDVASGAIDAAARPGLVAALTAAGPGDTLVVWRLDRITRHLQSLLELLADLEGRGVTIRSITDPIDTRSASGLLTAQIFGALAQFERSQLHERQQAGIAAARRRGVRFGRPAALSDKQVAAIRKMSVSGETVRYIGTVFKVSRATVCAVLCHRAPYE